MTAEVTAADAAEIVTFGLLPEFIGKGLGGFALTRGVQKAWALAPAVNRVWPRNPIMTPMGKHA